jgi:cell division protein FtsQ
MLIRRKGNRRRDEASRLKLPALPWRRIGMALGSLAVLGALLGTLGWMLNRPIERVTVQGSFQRVSAFDIEKLARRRIVGNGLVSVKLQAVRSSLLQLPWVDEVSVARQWPNGLRVQVREQVAMARWNDTQLVNVRGNLFDSEPRFMPAGLPQLRGPEGTDAEVVARYQATQGRLIENGMRLVALELDARGAWQFTLDNGVTVRLGRRQIDERLARFEDVALPLLAARVTEISYIDMRYTNGFAVGWRGGATRLAQTTLPEDSSPDV